MTGELEPAEDRFVRISQATAGITPTPDFGLRVMAAIAKDPQRDVSSWIARFGTIGIPAVAVLAGLLVFWAIDNDADYQDAVMVASHDFEQEW